MPEVEVVFYRENDGTVPVLDWLDNLIPKARAKCIVKIERLRELGHELRRPEADYLRDNIYELRIGFQGVNYRLLYFFEGTTLAPGAYLIVWADEDGGDEPGLHANFKLAKDGEIISLTDSDDRGNQLIDSITFEAQIADVSFGRYPDGSETLQVLPNATPGVDNLSTGLVADFDGDGSVGFTDFLQFAQQFGKKQGDAGFDSQFDLDGDGNVGFSDFLRFAQDFS